MLRISDQIKAATRTDVALRAQTAWTGMAPAQFGPRPADGNEVADYIFGEMKINSGDGSGDFRRLSKKVSDFAAVDPADLSKAITRVALLKDALDDWRSLVGYGQKWDHKRRVIDRWGKVSIIFGVELDYDVWSNIHYGYVGCMAGLPAPLLLDGAGMFQAIKSKVPEGWVGRWLVGGKGFLQSLDDSRDQAAIRLGARLYAQYGRELTREQFLAALRSDLGLLITIDEKKLPVEPPRPRPEAEIGHPR